jgi:hypothetical protein
MNVGNWWFQFPAFPELCKLKIEGSEEVVCRGKVDFGSLRFSSLLTISEFTCQIDGFIMEGLTNVEDLTIETCEELAPLWSKNIPNRLPIREFVPYVSGIGPKNHKKGPTADSLYGSLNINMLQWSLIYNTQENN